MGSWDYNHIILYFNNNKNIEGLVDQTMKCLDYEETDFSYLEEAGVYGPKWDYTYISRFNDELYYEQNFNNDTNQTLYLLNILFDEINIYTVEAMGSSTGDFYSSNEVSYDVIGGKCYNCSYYNKNISDINRNTFAFDLDLKLLEDVIDRAKEFGFSELVNIAEEKYKMIIDRKECIENGELIKVAASVEEYIVPECVTSIGNNAFDENKKLTKVVISDSVTDIGDYAFSNCEKLVNVVMSKNLKSIGECAFENCHSLTSIEIPDSVTKIENATFCECKMLASIVMPKTLKSIGDGAFCCCSFTGIELPNSVTSIGEDAFCGCEKLVSVVMPKALTSIGNYAFECCSSLTSIEIPDSVKEIGESAFTDCSNLENVTLPKQINNIGKAAFENTKWINDLNENFVIVGDGILIKYKGNEKKINIPDTVKYIGDGVFEEAKITSIFLPDSIVDIGKNAFEKCNKLESINIPASVISIGENAFKSCSKLTDIVLPDSVVNIGSSAFEKCSKLKSINIPESVVSVGENAFNGCKELSDLKINNNNQFISKVTFGKSIPKNIDIKNYEVNLDNGMFKKHIDTKWIWEKYNTEEKVGLFFRRLTPTFIKEFYKLIDAEVGDAILSAYIDRLNDNSIVKECNAAADFVINEYTVLSEEKIKALYDKIRTVKKGKNAVGQIQCNTKIMEIINK